MLNHARSGNALVLAVGLLAIVAAVMVTTTESAVNSVVRSKQRVDHQVISAAVNATLFRRESMLNQAALLGAEGFPLRFDPAYKNDMATVGFVGEENYGIDFVGDVEVRWRIEPVQAREAGIWKQNPRPDGEDSDIELPNTFLFRIAAEGRTYDSAGQSSARVQGVRYSAIDKEPLFRYIIFYSQDGAKGDIEFAHGPEFSARGNIHTNGAIYLGEPAVTASWNSLNSGVMGATRLGPYQDPYTGVVSPALVNAYDGIYRLSKRLMFNRANGFPIAGTQPGGFNTSWYDLAAGNQYPGETGGSPSYRQPPSGATSILAATYGGREINPQRVLDGVGMVTTESNDSRRLINGIPVRGVTQGLAKANDSRDRHRTDPGALKWSIDSLKPAPDGFDRKARSSDNGGRIVRLPAIMGNRAFEAQKLRYEDIDGDPTTDNHEYARPLFLSGNNEVVDYPATGPIVEAPGSYLSYALGSNDLAFTRVWRTGLGSDQNVAAGYNAWQVTSKSGGATATDPAVMGLIIRERMVPDLSYLSGSAASSASPDYIPYAYGKHIRSTKWPFWPIDVTARGGTDRDAGLRDNGDGTSSSVMVDHFTTTGSNAQIDSSKSRQAYVDGGILTASAAADETYITTSGGALSGYKTTNDTVSGYTRAPRFHRSNWRMFHLQRPKADEAAQGLLATFFDDFDATKSFLPNNGYLGPFCGPAVRQALDANGIDETSTSYNTILAGTSITAASNTSQGRDYFSVRYTGFIKPRYSEAYRFFVAADDGVRMWVDGQRVADRWRYYNSNSVTGAGTDGSTTARGEVDSVLLEKDRWYPVVIEMYEINQGDLLKVEWQSSNQAREVLPASRCAPPQGTSGGAFPRNQWSAVQAKVSAGSMLTNGKIGLMVRPQAPRAPATPGQIYQWTTQSIGGVSCAQVMPNPSIGTGDLALERNTGNGAAALNGPSMSYQVTFPAVAGLTYPRQYRVWVRAYMPAVNQWQNDSMHVRFNGAMVTGAGFGLSGFSANNSWQWISNVNDGMAVITVPAAGITYNLELFMREAGVALDRILLTTDTASTTGVPFANGLAATKQNQVVPLVTQTAPTVEATLVIEAESALPLAQTLPSPGAVDNTGRPLNTPPVAGAAAGLANMMDGRNPYLALCYSHSRGIFAEFRGTAATSEGRTPLRFFTGTSDATDANGEQGVAVAGVRRYATLTPALKNTPVPQQNIDGGTVRSNQKTNEAVADTSTPSTVNDLQTSEGKFDVVRVGAWGRRRSQNPQIELQRNVRTTWTFTLNNTAFPTQVFRPTGNPTDNGKDLQFYADDTSGTQTGNGMNGPASFRMDTWGGANPVITNWSGTYFEATWRSTTGPAWYDWGDTAGFDGVSNVASVLVGDTTFIDVPVTTTVTGNLVQREWVFGDANTYWYRNNTPPLYDGTANPVPFATFKSAIMALNPSAKVVRVSDIPNDAPAFTVPYRPDPAANYLALPANPTAWQNGTTPRTFSIDRTGTVIFDQNPMVGSWGTWWSGANRKLSVLPWATSPTLWASIANPPVTGSFRPDLWNYVWGGAQSPANYPRRTNITAPTDPTDAGGTQIGTPRWVSDQPTAWPPAGGLPAAVWLRIERATNDEATLKYAFTPGQPGPSDWVTVQNISGAAANWSLADWSNDLLIGPCLQSGVLNTTLNGTFTDLRVEFNTNQAAPEMAAVAAPANVLDAMDWEASDTTGVVDIEKYLAGQYQVFFGPYEITEDFLTWKTATGSRIVSESWIYQPREFWSQSRWWNTYDGGPLASENTAVEKDPGNVRPTTLTPTVRELLARSTLLTVDMAALQQYLANRALSDAVQDRIPNAGPTTIPAPAPQALASRFNGLIFAARSNRYPWNPNIQGLNPWNAALPNVTLAPASLTNQALLDLDPVARASAFSAIIPAMASANQTRLHDGITPFALRNALQPYTTLVGDQAPAFKPSEFHHGIRLVNGSAITWGFTGGGTPQFGTGKTAVVTPNLLYVQGDFNTVQPTVIKNGSATQAIVPVAIMGDQINFLSAAWNDSLWRNPGLCADGNGLTTAAITAQSSLARGWTGLPLPPALSMRVQAAVVTHNQPTTRDSVRIGEAASIISTMLFLEDWAGRSFDYTGSLVVMDSRRYTASYQLDGSKDFGPSPFGFMGKPWRQSFGLDTAERRWGDTASTIQIPGVYTAPNRTFTFNPDLLTPQGTPPFAPFGTSARGVGGWVRIMQ